MKIRSKELWQYLLESGALESQDEVMLQKAKRAYRKAYKRDWERKHRNIKELRLRFSSPEMNEISKRARLLHFNCRAYAKELILTSQEIRELVPRREELLEILQAVSVSENLLLQGSGNEKVKSLLFKAEQGLLKYLDLYAEI